MVDIDILFRFGVALFIGILIGLQREFEFADPDKELVGGVRTFAIMGLTGAASGLTTDLLGSPWPFVAVMLVFGIFLAITYYIDASHGEVGLTTELAAVITLLAGALAYWEMVIQAVANTFAKGGIVILGGGSTSRKAIFTLSSHLNDIVSL